MRDAKKCGGCQRRIVPGRVCAHILGADEYGPVECECDCPMPDGIGECQRCFRRIIPEENAA